MHPHIRTPPYRPPAFAPCADPDAPIQLPVDLSAARLADELHAQLTRLASGRDLRVLRRQARDDFRPVMRHARARRLAGHALAPLDIRRGEPRRLAPKRRGRRRRTGVRRYPGAAARAVKAEPCGRRSRAGRDRFAAAAPIRHATAPPDWRETTPCSTRPTTRRSPAPAT